MPVVAACSDGSGTADGVELLARQDGWRVNLAEEFGDEHDTILEIAYDPTIAQRAWHENVPDDLPQQSGVPYRPGRFGGLDDVNFETHAVVVWSAGSSSCPGWLHGLTTGDDTIRATTRERVERDGCQDIYVPYRMVLAVERSLVPDLSSLATARLEVDGRDRPRSLVAAYPAG